MAEQANITGNTEDSQKTRSYADAVGKAYESVGDAEQTGAAFSSLGERVKALEKEEHTSEKFLAENLSAEDWEPGSQVVFGNIDGKPIVWHVLDKQGQLRLIFAKEIVVQRPYNKMYIDTYWGTCSLRKWLNQEFISKCFSFQERVRIINTRVENRPNMNWKSDGGPGTVDKVFVLDIEEVQKYFPTDEDRKTGMWWWLRNPGSGLLSTACVYEDGSIYDYGINNNYVEGGVRPAMWVRIKQ